MEGAHRVRTQQGIDRIRRSYQKKEFLMARVTLDQMEYKQAENIVVPVLTIDSGPKVIVRTTGAKISRGSRPRTRPDLSGTERR